MLGLNALLASLALALIMLSDAISDPIIGLFIDYKYKEGRSRAALMSKSVLITSVAFLLLFSLDARSSQFFTFMQLLILGIILRLSLTAYIIPREAIGNQIFTDYVTRNHLWAANAFFSSVGAALALGPALLFFITDWNQRISYIQACSWAVLVYLIFSHTCIQFLKRNEIVTTNVDDIYQKITVSVIWIEISKLFKNKSWRMLFIGCLFFSVQMSLSSGTGLYINNYIWFWTPKDLFWGGIVSLPGSILGAALLFLVTVRNKKPTAIAIGGLAVLITPILLILRLLEIYSELDILPLVGDGALSHFWWIWSVHQFLENFLWTMFWILIASMFSDVVEEHQVNIGERLDGLVLSANNLVNKSISSLGILLSGFLLNLVGFDAAQSDLQKQTAIEMLGIFNIYTMLILFPFALYFIRKYTISHTSHSANIATLKRN